MFIIIKLKGALHQLFDENFELNISHKVTFLGQDID